MPLLFLLLLLLFSGLHADTLLVHIPGFASPGAFWRPPAHVAKKAPVIVWFHGGMGSANCAKGLSAGLALRDSGLGLPPAWIVSASACEEHHWVNAGPALVDALLDSLEHRRGYAVDTVELAGVSDGGLGVVAYSLEGRRPVRNRLMVSTYAGLIADPLPLSRQSRVRQGRWVFLQGGADRLFPASRTRPWMKDFCSTLGAMQCLVRFDGQGEHDWSWWRTHRLDWLRQGLNPSRRVH